MLTHNGRAFPSLAAALPYLRAIGPGAARFAAQSSLARQAFARLGGPGAAFERYMAYLEADRAAYGAALASHAAFEDHFRDELALARRLRRCRDRRDESLRAVRASWAHEPRALAWLAGGLPREAAGSKSFLDALRALARSVWSWDRARRAVNCAVRARLAFRGKGVRLQPHVTTSDLVVARRGRFRGAPLPVDGAEVGAEGEWLRKHGMRISAHGVVCSVEGEGEDEGGDEDDEAVGFELGDKIAPASDIPIDPDLERPRLPLAPPPSSLEPCALSDSDPNSNSTSSSLSSSPPPGDDSLRSPWGSGSPSYTPSPSSSPSSPNSNHNTAPPALPPSSNPVRVPATTSAEWKRCGCSSDVPDAWAERVSPPRALGLGPQRALLRAWAGFRLPCYRHTRCLAARLGLAYHGVEAAELRRRLGGVRARWALLRRVRRHRRLFRWFRRDYVHGLLFDDDDEDWDGDGDDDDVEEYDWEKEEREVEEEADI